MSHSHSHAGHSLGHGHAHGHGHHHHPADFGRAFLIGIILNLGFVVVEAIYGWQANSMALLADAGHNLADVLGLATAWVGAVLAKRPASRRFSYGFRGASILAALVNAVLLLIAVCLIVYHAAWRLIVPDLVKGETVILVAAIGIRLVDFKMEFGRIWENEYARIILADEISPDGCRLWDMTTNEKLDKDRFRRDLGGEAEAYQEVARRLGLLPEGESNAVLDLEEHRAKRGK